MASRNPQPLKSPATTSQRQDDPQNEQPSGKRDARAAATRAGILRTARAAFAQSGYDGVSLREIARAAGIDPRLVSHYFESKAELFTEALELTTESRPMVPPVTEDAAAVLLAGRRADTSIDGYLMTIRSTSNPEAVKILRAVIEQYGERRLAAELSGDHRQGRAALLIAINMGILLMRDILGSAALTGPDATELIPYLEAALAAAAGDIGESAPSS